MERFLENIQQSTLALSKLESPTNRHWSSFFLGDGRHCSSACQGLDAHCPTPWDLGLMILSIHEPGRAWGLGVTGASSGSTGKEQIVEEWEGWQGGEEALYSPTFRVSLKLSLTDGQAKVPQVIPAK